MANFVGIDLGTTFSAVAHLDETGRPKIVHNEWGQNITPSVISYDEDEGKYLIGEQARKILWTDPDTVGRFKREMGNDKTYFLAGEDQTPTRLSALVLSKLKKDAEKTIGSITEAVVTIPANWGNEQREATMEAAKRAGLTVKYIINEPTAAALYYAYKDGQDIHGTFAVYDLGGGTFDVSIIKVDGQDIDVIATEGLNRLGGDDFDDAILTMVKRKCKEATGDVLDEQSYTKNDAEEDKISLSARDHAKAMTYSSKGKANIPLTRAEFEEAISPLIAQTEMLCETALDEAGLTVGDIDQVFLSGGSTRIPCIRKSVARIFGKEPVATANVDEAVALGAALYAAYKGDRKQLNPTQRNAVDKVSVQECTSMCYGTKALSEGVGGVGVQRNVVMIEKGKKIPCSASKSFYTMVYGQLLVECVISESKNNETDPRFTKHIWQGMLELPEGRPAGQEIKVTFSYDTNQTMKCSFRDVESGHEQAVNLKAGVGRSDLLSGGDANIDDFLIE